MMLFALSLLLFPLISVAAISDSGYLKQNLDGIKCDEFVAIKEELGRVIEWKFRDVEEIVNIKKFPNRGIFYSLLSHFGNFLGQTRNFASSTFLGHYFAGCLHNFAFCIAGGNDCSILVTSCDGNNCFFSRCFNRAATCSVYRVLFGRNQNSFFR